MEKKKAFHAWGSARFHLNFPNGNHLSTVWASGTYTENHDNELEYELLLKKTNARPVFDSDTVEIMFSCPEKLEKKILKRYNDGVGQPIGYLPQDKWLEILKLLSNPTPIK